MMYETTVRLEEWRDTKLVNSFDQHYTLEARDERDARRKAMLQVYADWGKKYTASVESVREVRTVEVQNA